MAYCSRCFGNAICFMTATTTAFNALLIMIKVLLFPLYVLMQCAEEISGEGRWYRRQRRKMAEERPQLSDGAFLNAVNADRADEPLWLAVRQAVAEKCGLLAENVYPQDRLTDLWRMQWIGPDLLDFQFRMERILEKKLTRASVTKFLGPVRYGQLGEFREFAEAVVRGLSDNED